MKKVLIFLLLVCLTFLLMYGVGYVTYNFFETKSFKKQLEELGEYKQEENEVIIKNITYGKRYYSLSIIPDKKTMDFNVLLKNLDKYYLLKTVPGCKIVEKNKNILIVDNDIYVHCDGATNVIMKYTVTEGFIGEKEFVFNFEKTPNSDFHYLNIRKIDDRYIYLNAKKIDENIEEGEKVQCALKSRKCYYEKEKKKNEKKTSKKKD